MASIADLTGVRRLRRCAHDGAAPGSAMSFLDLAGPELLGVYVLLFGATVVALFAVRARMAGRHTEPVRLDDPYLVAFLRGGALEPVQLATARLIYQGELEVGARGTLAHTRPAGRAVAPSLEATFEQAVYGSISAGATGLEVAASPRVTHALGELAASLGMRNLILDQAAVRRLRRWRVALALGLFGVGLVALGVALSRGRADVVFAVMLVLLMITCSSIVGVLVRGMQRTRAGHATVAALQRLHGDARVLAPASPEALLLAAAWGATMAGWEATVRMAFPSLASSPPRATTGCASGSTCGGVDGGGCGGCGGCGR